MPLRLLTGRPFSHTKVTWICLLDDWTKVQKNIVSQNGGFNGGDFTTWVRSQRSASTNPSKQWKIDGQGQMLLFVLSIKICEEKGNNKPTCQNQNSPDVYDMFEVNLIIPKKKSGYPWVQWEDCINILGRWNGGKKTHGTDGTIVYLPTSFWVCGYGEIEWFGHNKTRLRHNIM